MFNLTLKITADATTVTTAINALRQRTDSLDSPMTSPCRAQEIAEIKRYIVKARQKRMRSHTKQVKWVCR